VQSTVKSEALGRLVVAIAEADLPGSVRVMEHSITEDSRTSHASAGQINNALRDNFSFPIVAQI
jgi:hypothetical protein